MAVAQFGAADDAERYVDAHGTAGPTTRFFRSRIHLVSRMLVPLPGGDLLDVGCGPGMMVREILDSRPGDFRIIALDRSAVMVEACARRIADAADARALVGRIEALPFRDDRFDVVLAMGVLEYVDANVALAELARVARPGGTVVVTMLNPTSPYRFVEWHVFWHLLRVLGAVETVLGVPADRRHRPPEGGLRTYRRRRLHKLLVASGLLPVDTVYFDVTLLVPPLDRLVRRWTWTRRNPDRTISRGPLGRLGSAYLVASRK